MTDTTVTAEVKDSAPEASRKARRSRTLALVHAALAVGVLAVFVFWKSHTG